MPRPTLKSQATEIANLKKQLSDLTNVSEAKKEDVFPTTQGDTVVVLSQANGMSIPELFNKAMEEFSFVSYGAVAQALGLDHTKLFGDTMDAVIDEIERLEVDHLVTSKAGTYGKKAPIEAHHASLQALGYTVFPEKSKPRTKKAKPVQTGGIDVTKLAKALKLMEVMDL